MTSFYRGWVPRLSFHNFRGDFFGGLTAAIVALPLALAFGVASGAGPSAGLYGAIAIGFLAALFGGTPSQVSGPTGPMTVLMASVFTTLIARNPDSGLALAFTVVVLGGPVTNGHGGSAPRQVHHPDPLYRHLWLYVRGGDDHHPAANWAAAGPWQRWRCGQCAATDSHLDHHPESSRRDSGGPHPGHRVCGAPPPQPHSARPP
jgi:hypothetical protein